MKKLAALLVILALSYSCAEAPKQNPKMQEVMAIHDEVMPKMNELASLTAQLKAKVDTTATGQAYEAGMKDLQEAHTLMMDWMSGFGDRFDHEEILKGKELSNSSKTNMAT